MPMDGRGEAVPCVGVVAMSGGFGFPIGARIPLTMRGLAWEDQVPRREEFEREHPEVRITFLGPIWEARIGEEVITTQFHLQHLLDVLEERFPPP
jgi:hypothetical protein